MWGCGDSGDNLNRGISSDGRFRGQPRTGHMNQSAASIIVGRDDIIRCAGVWKLQHLSDLEQQIARCSWPEEATLVCDASNVSGMDTGGAVLLQGTLDTLKRKGRQVALQGLQPDFAQLLNMVSLNWTSIQHVRAAPGRTWLDRIGHSAWTRLRHTVAGVSFLGESTVVLLRLLPTPRLIRWRALLSNLDLDGFKALPITGLLTFLMGVVIAYQGAEQLRTVGANIFVVDLVGISILREIAPLTIAILIAGRSGSSYTAQIGTMKVTEELDALRTLGLAPLPFLVLPRVLALVIALPLLTVYADIVGVFGGMLIAAGQLGVTFNEFISRFQEAIAIRHFWIGLVKAPVFAVIIGLVGCYQGFQIRGGVDDVGRHTTISVVQSIFLVIVFDALFSVLLSWLKL